MSPRVLRTTALVAVLTLAAGACSGGGGDSKGASENTESTVRLGRPELPAPPAPLELPASPAEAPAALVDAFAAGGDEGAAALLAAFQLAGVPVVDGEERSLTTADDTMGIPWSLVWTAATAPDPRARQSLSEIAGLFGVGPKLDTDAVAEGLLAALRAGLGGDPSAPGVAPIALLVQEESRRANDLDLADPAVTSDQVVVSTPTAVLLVSTGVLVAIAGPRAAASQADTPTSGAIGDAQEVPTQLIAHVRSEDGVMARSEPPGGCAEDTAGQWGLWVASKLTGGVVLPGLGAWDGAYSALVDYVAEKVPQAQLAFDIKAFKGKVDKFSKVTSLASAVLSGMSLVVAIQTHSGKVELKGGEPLVRTKGTTYPGETKDIAVTVSYDYGKLDKERLASVNCVLAMLGAVGNNSTFPAPGGISDVRVEIKGGLGFGQGLVTKGSFVVFPTSKLKQFTDKDGVATFPVAGRAQPRSVPDNAKPFQRIFTVVLSASAEATDENSIAKTFLDSLLCISPKKVSITSCLDPIADIAKQFSWSLGEWEFKLTDWGLGAKVIFSGLNLPLHTADNDVFDLVGEVNVCPAGEGKWSYSGTFHYEGTAGGVVFDGFVTDVQGNQDPENASLILASFADPAAEQGVLDSMGHDTGVLTLTGGMGNPKLKATVYSGLDKLIGTFPLTATVEAAECPSS